MGDDMDFELLPEGATQEVLTCSDPPYKAVARTCA